MNCAKSIVAILLISVLILCSAVAEETVLPPVEVLPSLYVVKEGEESPFLEAGADPVITESSYKSDSVSIEITHSRLTTVSTPNGKKEQKSSAEYWVADIYLRDITSLKRAYANDRFGSSSDKISNLALASGALLAVNGDYASELSKGIVVANGVPRRKTANAKRDMLMIRKDGTCSIIPYGTNKPYSKLVSEGVIQQDEVWQIFLFGPALLNEDGSAAEYKTINRKTDVCPANPRTVFGYYEPGHYCIMVCDGRTAASLGLRLEVVAQLMSDLGCKLAYNLDGGQSSQFWYNGKIQNSPYKNGRKINDILLIAEPSGN